MQMRSLASRTTRAAIPAGLLALAAAAFSAAPAAAQADTTGGAGTTPQAMQEPASSVQVAGAVLTTGIRDHMPVDSVTNVPSDVGRVFLWTRITGAQDSTVVAHVWYRGDEQAASVQLPVRGPDWRTYSTKQILPSWTGPWHVDVVDANGNVLKTVTFQVEGMGAGGGAGAAADTAGGTESDTAGG